MTTLAFSSAVRTLCPLRYLQHLVSCVTLLVSYCLLYNCHIILYLVKYHLESFAENLHIKESDSPPLCNILDTSSCSRVKVEGEVCISEVISNHDGIQYVAYTEPLCNDTPTTTSDTPTTVNDTPTTPEHINDAPIINNTATPRRSSRNKTKM